MVTNVVAFFCKHIMILIDFIYSIWARSFIQLIGNEFTLHDLCHVVAIVNFWLHAWKTGESLQQCLKDWVNTQDKASSIHQIVAIHMYQHYPMGVLTTTDFIKKKKKMQPH